MKRNILILVLLFAIVRLIAQFLNEKEVADKWRKQEAEREAARIAAENDPEWQATIRRVRARRAPNLANNYLNSLENGDIQNV